MHDYILVGGGLGGATLAYRLIKAGASVMVLDEPGRNISSAVAAGLVNPLTGKRTALTWKASEIFDALHAFYPMLEKELGQNFFDSLPTYKLFDTVYEQNEWIKKQEEQGSSRFISGGLQALDPAQVNNPLGALRVEETGRLNIQNYLRLLHQWLRERSSFAEKHFDPKEVVFEKGCLSFQGLQSKALIFCEGSYAPTNPFFNYLPHRPVHGEILEIEMKGFYRDRIINRGIFIVPSGEDKYLAGATYAWDLTEPLITEEGRQFIRERLDQLVNLPYTVTRQWAGIRPATKDRRPFLGSHPEYPNLHIFGGFGSKGVSLVPYLSECFANYLLHHTELPREADICRVNFPGK